MLKISQLIKSFPGGFEPVLKGISLEIEAGDFCVILGSNGSGKSTLMRCLSGDYELDSGAVYLGGQDVTRRNRSKFIASVIQDTNKGTIPEMTLLENMALSKMRSQRARFCFYKKYEKEVVQEVKGLGIGLESYLYKPLGLLSGGQRQMVATLMAMSSAPQLLLLDEHTSALDPKTQHILMNYTAHHIYKNKVTSLMVTHKLDDAVRFGNRLIMLHQGKIVKDVKGAQKSGLGVEELLSLFHQYEDQMLTAGKEGRP